MVLKTWIIDSPTFFPFDLCIYISYLGDFPSGSDSEESNLNAVLGSIPRSGRSPGEGNDNLLQYFCLKNSMDRGPWWAAIHGVTKSWTRLSN